MGYFLSYLRSMAAIYDFRHTQRSGSILISLFVLPDQKNASIAVGISLLILYANRDVRRCICTTGYWRSSESKHKRDPDYVGVTF